MLKYSCKILLLWLSFVSTVYATPPLILEADSRAYPVNPQSDIAEDTASDWTIEQVSSPLWNNQFASSLQKSPDIQGSNSTYWFRFKVQNPLTTDRHIALRFDNTLLSYLDVYVDDISGRQHWKMGSAFPFEQRPLKHPKFAVPFTVKAQQTATVYIRVKATILWVPITLMDIPYLMVEQHNEAVFAGAFYGVIALITFYNLFILFAARELIYLYSALFNLSFLLFITIVDGYASQYFWPKSPWLTEALSTTPGFFICIFMILLIRAFLELQHRGKILNWYLNGMLVLLVVGACLSFFLPLQDALIVSRIVTFPVVLIVLFLSWYYWFKGVRAAKYLVLSWSLLLLGLGVIILFVLEIIPGSFWVINAPKLGFLGFIVLLSFGLADRINNLRLEKLEEAQARQKVAEENLLLQNENTRMSTELGISRQLQQMVLPTPGELSEISKLDIACWMEPADEVGGDYYDVLQYHDKVIIGIGDVTGHGLASGALMLMVQTAIRTLSIADLNDPIEFFRILNQTIYDNLKRMSIDKNLTLLVMDYQDGCIRISGQHEECLVVRKTGHTERIDTLDLGFMIGITLDIEPFVGTYDIELQPGDGVVLYTDGITEAFGSGGKQYGLERLCAVIERHWMKPAADIQTAVMQDFEQHTGDTKIADDCTLMIIKQLAS